MSLADWFAQRGIESIALASGGSVPACFSDARAEHLATRTAAGLFDFSFMGCWEFTGATACAALAALQTRNIAALPVGRIAYTLLCEHDGTVRIDATVWRLAHDRYWLFAGRRSDDAWIAAMSHRRGSVPRQRSAEAAVIAVQGPRSAAIVARVLDAPQIADLPYFGFASIRWRAAEIFIGRIGYSGEFGFELVVPQPHAVGAWQALCNEGVAECGFAAADTLRIECGYILFGTELATPVFPGELGLARLVDFGNSDFSGREALWQAGKREPQRRLVGLQLHEGARQLVPAVARTAVLTSSCASPTLERFIGLGFVAAADSDAGTLVYTDDAQRALVCRLPFYDPWRRRPRGRIPISVSGSRKSAPNRCSPGRRR